MTVWRSRAVIVVMAILMAGVPTLTLPVAAQTASQVYQQVRLASPLATLIQLPDGTLSEPAGLAMLGIALAISAHVARRRLLS